MQEAQKGDSVQYELLLREISVVLKAFVLKRIGDAEIAEEILQEILLSIHKARHTFNPEKEFSPWMYAIARFRLIDYFRRWSRTTKKEVYDELLIEKMFMNESNAQESLSVELKDAVGELPEKQQEVIRLLKLQGLSVKETALKTGLSEGAVKVTAHRGYKVLRRKLKGMSYEN
jgi:RNA polymerase sigma-70 factor, ECF subfamily